MKRSLAAPTPICWPRSPSWSQPSPAAAPGPPAATRRGGGADVDHVRRRRRLPRHHRARLRRDHHRVGAHPGRHPRLDRPGPRPRAGRRPRRRHQDHLGRQRRRLHRLVRRGGRGGRRRGARALRRRRRRADRRDRQARARPDPGDQLRHHRGGVRQAHQDRAGRRLPRGALDHPVADLARDGRQGARSYGARRGRRGRHPGTIDEAAGGQPRAPGRVADLRLPRRHRPLHRRHVRPRRTRACRSCATSAWRTRPAVADAIKPGEFYGTVSAERRPTSAPTCSSPGSEIARQHRRRSRTTSCSARSPRSPRPLRTPRATSRSRWPSTNPTPLSIPVIVSDFLPHVVRGHRGLMRPSSRRGTTSPGLRGEARGSSPPCRSASLVSVVALGAVRCASLLVGARAVPLAAVWDAAHPMHAVVEAAASTVLPWPRRRCRPRAGRGAHAGPDPQPARRSRHPGRQRRSHLRDGRRDDGLRRSPGWVSSSRSPSSVPPSPRRRSTASRRWVATARPR